MMARSKVLEVLFRVVGLFLCAVFAVGSLWTGRDGTYPNLSGLSHSLLLLLCALSPARPSRALLVALLIALVLACIDFAIRALPALRSEQFPGDIVGLYVVELVIVIWFIVKHISRPGGLTPANRT